MKVAASSKLMNFLKVPKDREQLRQAMQSVTSGREPDEVTIELSKGKVRISVVPIRTVRGGD
jgi:molybdopterin-binding protein